MNLVGRTLCGSRIVLREEHRLSVILRRASASVTWSRGFWTDRSERRVRQKSAGKEPVGCLALEFTLFVQAIYFSEK